MEAREAPESAQAGKARGGASAGAGEQNKGSIMTKETMALDGNAFGGAGGDAEPAGSSAAAESPAPSGCGSGEEPLGEPGSAGGSGSGDRLGSGDGSGSGAGSGGGAGSADGTGSDGAE